MRATTSEIHGEANGVPARLFTLENSANLRVQVSELGAHLVSVVWREPGATDRELTLGHGSFAGWLENSDCYLGATVGRFGNRIARGGFRLDGVGYQLATNNAPHDIPCHLHGGPGGFHTKVWRGEMVDDADRRGVRLTTVSGDGEEGYPGKMDVAVTYWLNDDNELSWHAEATTDKATPVNLINHVYWNLGADPGRSVTDHEMQILADAYVPVERGMIPTGEIRPVSGTPMDFTRPRAIGDRIDADDEQLEIAGGYDHCWVLRGENPREMPPRLAALVRHPETGRELSVLTNQPGVQFYAGNFLSGRYRPRAGLCLETGGFPDSPNHAHFPSAILRPGETYRHDLAWRIS